jgi:hypothetical protein
MARILRVKINWTGFTGAPGYSNLHFEQVADDPMTQSEVNEAITMTQTWIATFRAGMPPDCITAVDGSVVELDENYGTVQAFWNGTPAAAAAGTGPGSYAAGSGACVNWSTDGVWNGRRVRGRTFIVPLGSYGMSSTGNLDDGKLTTWRAATQTFINGGSFVRLVVWKRPTVVLGEPLPDGGAYDVTSFTINDKAAQLRSRRD